MGFLSPITGTLSFADGAKAGTFDVVLVMKSAPAYWLDVLGHVVQDEGPGPARCRNAAAAAALAVIVFAFVNRRSTCSTYVSSDGRTAQMASFSRRRDQRRP